MLETKKRLKEEKRLKIKEVEQRDVSARQFRGFSVKDRLEKKTHEI